MEALCRFATFLFSGEFDADGDGLPLVAPSDLMAIFAVVRIGDADGRIVAAILKTESFEGIEAHANESGSAALIGGRCLVPCARLMELQDPDLRGPIFRRRIRSKIFADCIVHTGLGGCRICGRCVGWSGILGEGIIGRSVFCATVEGCAAVFALAKDAKVIRPKAVLAIAIAVTFGFGGASGYRQNGT